MSRATAALPPGLRRSQRRAARAGRLSRHQAQEDESINEDTDNESDMSEGLQALHSGPSEGLSGLHSGPSEGLSDVQLQRQREAELRDELLARRSGQVPYGPDRPSDRRPLGPERRPLGPERFLFPSEHEVRGEARARGESRLDSFFEGAAFEGPDLRDPEVRAAVGFLTSNV